jgi:hypothetical protein
MPGTVGKQPGTIAPPTRGGNSAAPKASVIANGSAGVGPLQLLGQLCRRRPPLRARAITMQLFQKIFPAHLAGVQVAINGSSHNPMSHRSVSVVPLAVWLYDVCSTGKPIGSTAAS